MHGRTIIEDTLAEVQALRTQNFRGSDELIIRLLRSYPDDEALADHLWADLPANAAVHDIADLLSLWSWRAEDNGARILRTAERWIEEGRDSKKIEVALNLDAFPFLDDEVRVVRLVKIAAKFPQLAPRCQRIIDQSRAWIENGNHGMPSA